MKKVLLMTILLATASVSMAQNKGYATFEYTNETKRVDNTDSVKGALVAGFKTEEGMDYSVKMETSQSDWGSGSLSSGFEVRAKKTFDPVIGSVQPYLGVRLGEKLSSSTHFSHYAVDAGVKFPIAGALSGDVGTRYRNAFDTVNAFESTRAHATLAYALTKQDSVAVRYSRAYGDVGEEKNAIRLSYTRSF